MRRPPLYMIYDRDEAEFLTSSFRSREKAEDVRDEIIACLGEDGVFITPGRFEIIDIYED